MVAKRPNLNSRRWNLRLADGQKGQPCKGRTGILPRSVGWHPRLFMLSPFRTGHQCREAHQRQSPKGRKSGFEPARFSPGGTTDHSQRFNFGEGSPPAASPVRDDRTPAFSSPFSAVRDGTHLVSATVPALNPNSEEDMAPLSGTGFQPVSLQYTPREKICRVARRSTDRLEAGPTIVRRPSISEFGLNRWAILSRPVGPKMARAKPDLRPS
jgi:hypothetical protein